MHKVLRSKTLKRQFKIVFQFLVFLPMLGLAIDLGLVWLQGRIYDAIQGPSCTLLYCLYYHCEGGVP